MVSQACRRLTHCHDLRVSSRIVLHQVAIEAASDNLFIFNNHSSNGYFAGLKREPRLLKRKLHPAGIIARHHGTVILGRNKHALDQQKVAFTNISSFSSGLMRESSQPSIIYYSLTLHGLKYSEHTREAVRRARRAVKHPRSTQL